MSAIRLSRHAICVSETMMHSSRTRHANIMTLCGLLAKHEALKMGSWFRVRLVWYLYSDRFRDAMYLRQGQGHASGWTQLLAKPVVMHKVGLKRDPAITRIYGHNRRMRSNLFKALTCTNCACLYVCSIGEVRPSWAEKLYEGRTYPCWYDQSDKLDDSCICQRGEKSSVRGLLFAGQRFVCWDRGQFESVRIRIRSKAFIFDYNFHKLHHN